MARAYEDEVSAALRALFSRYGYSCYRMSKFEEYDLYANYRDFLVDGRVISFTDTDGRLMALKPDVTLSMVRHYKDVPGMVLKRFYNEHVFRVSRRSHRFEEVMQVGLECMGAVDRFCICEVLTLAVEALRSVSPHCVLDVSHLGIVSALMDEFDFSSAQRADVLECFRGKNADGVRALCSRAGLECAGDILAGLVGLCSAPDEAMPYLRRLLAGSGGRVQGCLRRFEEIVGGLVGVSDVLRVDFSVVNDLSYYSGVVFRGFVEGVPSGVLAGGQYDGLMRKMGHGAGAVGFAVYLDGLERLAPSGDHYDVDTVLLYGEGDDPAAIRRAVEALSAEGVSVSAQRSAGTLRFRRLMRLNGNGVEQVDA